MYVVQYVRMCLDKSSLSYTTQAIELQRSVMSFYDNESAAENVENTLARHLLSAPIVTSNDKYLVWVSASRYEHSKAVYSGFHLVVLALEQAESKPSKNPIQMEKAKSKSSGSMTTGVLPFLSVSSYNKHL